MVKFTHSKKIREGKEMKLSDLLFKNENLTRDKKRCYGMHRGYYVSAEIMDYDFFGNVQFGQLDDAFR